MSNKQPDRQSPATSSLQFNADRNAPNHAKTSSHDEIAIRAFEIYEEKNCLPGQCTQNWLRAEREIQYEESGSTEPSESNTRRQA